MQASSCLLWHQELIFEHTVEYYQLHVFVSAAAALVVANAFAVANGLPAETASNIYRPTDRDEGGWTANKEVFSDSDLCVLHSHTRTHTRTHTHTHTLKHTWKLRQTDSNSVVDRWAERGKALKTVASETSCGLVTRELWISWIFSHCTYSENTGQSLRDMNGQLWTTSALLVIETCTESVMEHHRFHSLNPLLSYMR